MARTEISTLNIIKYFFGWNRVANVLYSTGGYNHALLMHFKGTVSQNLSLRIFSWIVFPQAPENNISVISNFFRKFTEIFASQGAPPCSINDTGGKKFNHLYSWCYWYWWQIIWAISDCWHLKVNLKEKQYLYVNSTVLPKGVKKNNWRFFSFAASVNDTGGGGVPWAANTSVNFREKNWTTIMLYCYSGAWGKLIHEKKPEVENLVALSL